MADPLPEQPIDITYQDALIVMRDEVNRYLRANPHTRLSREECISIVNESFVQAYYGHNTSKGPFLRRARFLARHAITDYLRQQKNKIKPVQDTEGILNLLPDKRKSNFNLTEFARELSPDADKLLWVVRHLDEKDLNPLLDLDKHIPQLQQSIVARKRELLFRLLIEKGWTGDRIIAAYHEIVQALADW